MILARVVLLDRAVTSNSSSPVSLIVPANTWSPGALSTGMLSPVTGAWLMAPLPLVTLPSSGTRSPGLMRTVAPMATEATGVAVHAPLVPSTKASSGASSSKPLIAFRARSTALASMSSAIAYKAITIAASGH